MVVTQKIEKLESLQKVMKFLGNWQDRTKKESQVGTYFDLLKSGKITAAKKVLEAIKEKSDSAIWYRGYLTALEGMVSALEARRDRSMFINQRCINESDKLGQKFLRQSKNRLHAEFDRGYFTAWADYLQMMR